MNRIGSTHIDDPSTPLEDSVGAPDADLELLGSVSAP
jgi:hypothetical protein